MLLVAAPTKQRYLDIVRHQGHLAIKPVKQNLSGCHDSLRQPQQNSSLLNHLATIYPLVSLNVRADSVLARWAVSEVFLRYVKIVKRCENHSCLINVCNNFVAQEW